MAKIKQKDKPSKLVSCWMEDKPATQQDISNEIMNIVKKSSGNITYMEATIMTCEKYLLDMSNIKPLLTPAIIENIREDAYTTRLFKSRPKGFDV